MVYNINELLTDLKIMQAQSYKCLKKIIPIKTKADTEYLFENEDIFRLIKILGTLSKKYKEVEFIISPFKSYALAMIVYSGDVTVPNMVTDVISDVTCLKGIGYHTDTD